jgi:hypothetical protein
MLRRRIDPDRPLSEYGMDSLGAPELRTRVETETECCECCRPDPSANKPYGDGI